MTSRICERESKSREQERRAESRIWKLSDIDFRNLDASAFTPVAVTRDDTVEIIFTSGATADPKGVVLTHRNVLANIVPVEREVRKYKKYGRPFFPIRFLNLLPLSHMFGQAMATFVPPMLEGTVIFMRGYNPQEIVRQIKTRRVSVLVSVPKILDVLADYVARLHPEVRDVPAGKEHVARRWWRYRAIHRLFGAKFWSFVVGAAPLETSLESFWGRLGFVVVQGYGLTETAPIVTLNHPFSTSKGSVGKPIGGVNVRIAADGEILVRGENVTTGYYGAPDTGAFEDGWFHTGDIGELDEGGRLFIRGRKKEMIVTPEGLNVFPEDVERAVNAVAGVKESAAVGVTQNGEERVQIALVVDPGIDPDAVIRTANTQLADHQRIRAGRIWPGAELPRTEGTRKLKRHEIRTWLQTGAAPVVSTSGAASVESVDCAVHRRPRDRSRRDAGRARSELARTRRDDGRARRGAQHVDRRNGVFEGGDGRRPRAHRGRAGRGGSAAGAGGVPVMESIGTCRRDPRGEPVVLPAAVGARLCMDKGRRTRDISTASTGR